MKEASAVKILLKKEGKGNRPSELEKILLGYYIKFGPGSQESFIYLRIERLQRGKRINRNFGIKSLLSQNWGHVFTPKFGRKMRELEGFQDFFNQGIDCLRIDIS